MIWAITIAPVELQTFDDVEFGLETLRLFDGDDTFIADLLNRRGDDPAAYFRGAPFAETVPTCATSSDEATLRGPFLISAMAAATARSMPRLRSCGSRPAATYFAPCLTIA